MPEPTDPPEPPGAALVPSPREGRPPFAQWLRKGRRGRDLTPRHAAGVVGDSRNYWAQLETGSKEPSLDFLDRLAPHTGLSGQVLAQWAHDNGPEPDLGPGHPHPPPRREAAEPPPAPPY